jgi:hypothetical protein
MNRRSFVVTWAVLLALGVSLGWAADRPKGGSAKVVVEGTLGTILRRDQTDEVTATIVAAGGEFVIDAGVSQVARESLIRLADQCVRGGSTAVNSPQLTVSGQLEFRATQVVGEQGELTDGPKAWVLIADSVTVTESRLE